MIFESQDMSIPSGNLKGINTSGSMKKAVEELEYFMIKEGHSNAVPLISQSYQRN